MKKMMFMFLALVIFAGQQAIALGADKTIANLKAAFIGESTASAKYAAFAEQAKKEGFMQIATMFEATSKAELIHATNHKTVLEKMGQKADPVKPAFKVATTKENLQDAISGETYELTKMYPGYIATAKEEDVNAAVKSFRWAMDTEKNHKVMYQKAIDALNGNKAGSLSKVYWVCPKCGNTYDSAKPEATCSLCSTKRDKYIKFGR
jgi:rubrerythrin